MTESTDSSPSLVNNITVWVRKQGWLLEALTVRNVWFLHMLGLICTVSLLTLLRVTNFEPPVLYFGETYRMGIAMSIAVSLPLMLDCLLDVLYLKLPNVQSPWLVVALLVPNLIQLVIYIRSDEYPYATGHTLWVIREIMLSGTLTSFHLRSGVSTKDRNVAIFIGLTHIWSQLLEWLHFCGYRNGTFVLWVVCLFISTVSSALFVIQQIISYRKQRIYELDLLASSLFLFNVVAKGIIFVIFHHQGSVFPFGLIDVIICTLATVLPGRKARRDIVKYELELVSKRDFVTYISHEIRAPLNIVSLGMEMVTKDLTSLQQTVLPSLKQHIETLHDIGSSCSTATTILNELLLVHKIEGGNLSLNRELVNVAEFITSVAKPFDVLTRQKNVVYNFDGFKYLDSGLVNENMCIYADRSKFSQCVRNLISNAIKFSSSGGTVTVYTYLVTEEDDRESDMFSSATNEHRKVHCVEMTENFNNNMTTDNMSYNGQVLRIEVYDTGPGISSANQRKLFKDIVQFDPNDLQGGGGSGVGLWISQAIVDLHGGTLGVESTPGKGSMFYIQMPVGRLTPEGEGKFSSLSTRSRVPSSVDETSSVHSTYCQFESEAMAIAIRAFRVCVADDSSLNRKMLNKILSLEVDKVVLCSDGLQCTEVIKESMTSGGNKVDMVIMDVEMPIANGVEATKLLRSMGYKGVVVFLTGNAQPEMRVKCLRSGGDLVIIKPCTVVDIKNALEFVAGRHIREDS